VHKHGAVAAAGARLIARVCRRTTRVFGAYRSETRVEYSIRDILISVSIPRAVLDALVIARGAGREATRQAGIRKRNGKRDGEYAIPD